MDVKSFQRACVTMEYSSLLDLSLRTQGRWRRWWHPTPVLLPGKSHGRRCLVGCSPWGREESDATEWLPFNFSLSCIGEGNGNPLQCSCLENPRGGGAWWAAIYGVAQSRTQLKWLSSSSWGVVWREGWVMTQGASWKAGEPQDRTPRLVLLLGLCYLTSLYNILEL